MLTLVNIIHSSIIHERQSVPEFSISCFMLKRLKKEGKIELLSDDRAAFCVRSGEVHQKRSLIFRDEILLFLAKLYWCGHFSGW